MVDIHPLNSVCRERFLEILRERNVLGSELASYDGEDGEERTGSQYLHILVCFQPSIRQALA